MLDDAGRAGKPSVLRRQMIGDSARAHGAGPLRVLVVIDSLAVGGTEHSVTELVPRVVDAGIDVTVATLHHREPGYEADLRRGGHDVRVLRSRGFVAKVRELRGLVRARTPDVVHTQLFDADLVGRVAATATPAKVLTSLVNTSYEPARRRDPRVRPHRLEAARLLEGWTARHLTDHFHAVSATVKTSAVRNLGLAPERVTVVERGRDPTRLGEPGRERRRRVRAALGLDPDARMLLNVGRQEFQKGQLDLLEAFDVIATARPDAVLLVAGPAGHSSRDLEERRRRSAHGDRIRILGARDDVPELLAAADVFVSPSLYEGMPGAVLEAFALGVPVVASAIPPHRDVVSDGVSGLLVRVEDTSALAAAVARVLDHPALARALAARARAEFAARFTLDASVRRMVELYDSVAQPARARAVASR
jgi:glycosyltransferase involved in cell wall biosynthesis